MIRPGTMVETLPDNAPVDVLTLRQPYASFVALGYKSIETRSLAQLGLFATRAGRVVAIHAAKGPPLPCAKKWLDQFRHIAAEHGLDVDDVDSWPRAEILALVTVEKVRELQPFDAEGARVDFTPGRCGLFIDAVEPLAKPIPFRGVQGFGKIAAREIVRAL